MVSLLAIPTIRNLGFSVTDPEIFNLGPFIPGEFVESVRVAGSSETAGTRLAIRLVTISSPPAALSAFALGRPLFTPAPGLTELAYEIGVGSLEFVLFLGFLASTENRYVSARISGTGGGTAIGSISVFSRMNNGSPSN